MQYEYWKSRLRNRNQQRVYDLMVAEFRKMNTEVDCGAIEPQACLDTYMAVYRDHAELFYLSNGARVTHTTGGLLGPGGQCTLHAEYLYTKREIIRYNTRINEICEDLRHKMPKGSELERERMICDYIIGTCRYELNDRYNQNAATALVDHKGQCSGFAKATKLLCDVFDIACIFVTGDRNDRRTGKVEPHAWNIIRVDGKHYHLDVTDMVSANEGKKKPYNYMSFNYTDTKIGADHRWDVRTTPACTTVYEDQSDPNARRLTTITALYQLRGQMARMPLDGEFRVVFDCNILCDAQRLLDGICDTIRSVLQQRRVGKSFSISVVGNRVTVDFRDH